MSSVYRTIGLVLCIAMVLTVSAQAGIISGREPKTGVNVLILDNSLGEYDAVAVLKQAGWPNPICAVYLRAGEGYTMTKVPDGTYDIYYMRGKGWDSKEKTFRTMDKMGKIIEPIIMKTDFSHSVQASYDGLWDVSNTNYSIYTVSFYDDPDDDTTLEEIDPDDFPKI